MLTFDNCISHIKITWSLWYSWQLLSKQVFLFQLFASYNFQCLMGLLLVSKLNIISLLNVLLSIKLARFFVDFLGINP